MTRNDEKKTLPTTVDDHEIDAVLKSLAAKTAAAPVETTAEARPESTPEPEVSTAPTQELDLSTILSASEKHNRAKRTAVVVLQRVALFLVCAAFLGGCCLLFLTQQKYVLLKDSEGPSHEILTTSTSEGDAIRLAATIAGPYDRLTYQKTSPLTATVVIDRAFPVSLSADGETQEVQVVQGTVGDLLAQCGVELSGEDFVEPAAETELKYGISAAVHRVTYEEEEAETEIGDDDVAEYKAKYEAEHPGEAFKESNANLYKSHLRHRLVDGKVESTEVLALTRVMMPRPADSYTFTPGIAQSRITGYDDIEMDEDGFPVNYTRVWEGAVCTAYSSSGGRGSSGLGLYCGTAAVNPNVIPYGTRMFITSADGQYVYGFCIATDTGTAMMEGYVDIDLYFEDNAECYQFGKRGMNVYFFD